MKRGAPLQRRTPLRAKTRLARVTPMVRTAARKRVKYTGPTEAQILVVLIRDGYACPCGHTVIGTIFDIQHRQRRSQGGTNCYCNLLTGHRECHNRWDSRLHPADALAGFTVKSRRNPADVPVLYVTEGGSQEWWQLLADGTRDTCAAPRRAAA